MSHGTCRYVCVLQCVAWVFLVTRRGLGVDTEILTGCVLRCVTVCYTVLQCVAMGVTVCCTGRYNGCCRVLQVCCSVLQCVTVCRSAACFSVTVCYSVLQCVCAMGGNKQTLTRSMLQCVVAWCSVFAQWVL